MCMWACAWQVYGKGSSNIPFVSNMKMCVQSFPLSKALTAFRVSREAKQDELAVILILPF